MITCVSGYSPEITKGENLTMHRSECRTPKILQMKQQLAPGNHGSKLGQDRNSIATITHSVISTAYVASPPGEGSNHKNVFEAREI